MATTARAATSRWADLQASGRWLGAGVLAGIVCGAAIGGIGGRLAMMLLRFTSGDGAVGLTSDDGFQIGVFSTATLFLVALTAVFGILGALGYLAVRPWLPERGRPAIAGVAFAVLGGANTIHADGIDFTALRPPALAVAMFLLLPAAFGAVLAVLAERWLAADKRSLGWFVPLVPLVAMPLGSLTGVLALAALGLVWLLPRVVPGLRGAWTSRPATWTGRVLLVAWLAWLAVGVGEVTADIL